MALDMTLRDKAKIASVPVQVEEEGRYVYCIAEAAERVSLGPIGLAGNEVYTIPFRDICAVAHNCQAQPYASENQEEVKSWAIAHQKVVEAACERWGTVLPLSFDTIIRGETGDSAEGNTRAWLEKECEELKRKLDKVRGKVEYGVQVFWHAGAIAQSLGETNPAIQKLQEEIKTQPKGLAYMHRQRLENLLKEEMATKANERFRDFYKRIQKHAEDIRVEKTKKAEPGLQMILNLSCLVSRDKYPELGEELDRINHLKGFWVRFTGPWPPYSFVGGA